jgi:hypothetical protein
MCLESSLPPLTDLSTMPQNHIAVPQPLPTDTHTMSWTDPLVAVQAEQEPVTGQVGDLCLPQDPFHRYEGPSAFGPGTEWGTEALPLHPVEPDTAAANATIASPMLDSDAEETHLPPGLLDSPPHQSSLPPPSSPHTANLHRLCDSILAPPPVAVLSTPPLTASTTTSVPHRAEEVTGPVMRHSKRIAAQPASNVKPAERARETKLKKLGIADTTEDPKEAKKQQLLLAYDGPMPPSRCSPSSSPCRPRRPERIMPRVSRVSIHVTNVSCHE